MPNRQQRRSSSAKYPTSLDAWEHDKLLKGLRLPAVGNGPERMVDFEIPDLAASVMRGEVPNPLASMALRVDTDVIAPAELGDDEKRTYFALMNRIIATHLRKPNLVEMTGSVEAAEAWVAQKMPPLHRILLWQRCVHIFSKEDVLRMIEDLEGGEVSGADVSSISDLATFPDVPAVALADAGGRAEGAGA